MSNTLIIKYSPSLEEVNKVSKLYFFENPDINYNFINKYESESIALFYLHDKLIGFVSYTKINARLLFIENTYIIKKFRSKGFGKILINDFLDYNANIGFYVLSLSSSSENSTRFWKNIGFINKNNNANDPKLLYKILVETLTENSIHSFDEQIKIRGDNKNYNFNFSVNSKTKKFRTPIIINENADCEIIWTKNNHETQETILKRLPENDLTLEDIIIIEKSIFE